GRAQRSKESLLNITAPQVAYPTSPLIRTDLPGPRAREVLARDNAVTSPSLPRAYSFVPKPRPRLQRRGRRRQRLPRLQRRNSGELHRARPPQGRRGGAAASRGDPALPGVRFLSPDLLGDVRRGGRCGPDVRPHARVLVQLRGGGGGGCAQARAVRDEATLCHQLSRR